MAILRDNAALLNAAAGQAYGLSSLEALNLTRAIGTNRDGSVAPAGPSITADILFSGEAVAEGTSTTKIEFEEGYEWSNYDFLLVNTSFELSSTTYNNTGIVSCIDVSAGDISVTFASYNLEAFSVITFGATEGVNDYVTGSAYGANHSTTYNYIIGIRLGDEPITLVDSEDDDTPDVNADTRKTVGKATPIPAPEEKKESTTSKKRATSK